MFKRVEITLTGPICQCDEMNLAWATPINSAGGSYLQIQCMSCMTILEVPNKQLKARFVLDTPYPSEIRRREEKTKVVVAKKVGDVIDFEAYHKKNSEDDLPS